MARKTHAVLDMIWTKLLIGADLPASLECGPRLVLAHGGRGVFINPATRIGSDVTIQQQVTIGVVRGEPAAPCIGDRLNIGAKASVLGAVSVGADATVGAHAVVIREVPVGATALGVPAKVRGR
jgi:serine acetyltransferase